MTTASGFLFELSFHLWFVVIILSFPPLSLLLSDIVFCFASRNTKLDIFIIKFLQIH